jgi:LysR family glycine cleavage system transcriptional activator
MTARLPPLGAIEAFVAAAHTGSLTAAATELNLTTSAVSRRVAALEHVVGAPLFHRLNRSLQLTSAGQKYLAAVEPALAQLSAAGAVLRGHGPRKRLRLNLLPSFASLWLLPRLASFNAEHPSIDLEIVTGAQPVDFNSERVDAAVRIGTGDWQSVAMEKLLPMRARPVCAPSLLQGRKALKVPADLKNHKLLSLMQPRGLWRRWLAEAGVEPFKPVPGGARFDSVQMLYEAAANGLGVGIAFDALADPFLRDGRLVTPFEHVMEIPYAYYLLYRRRDAGDKTLSAFRRWLKGQLPAA